MRGVQLDRDAGVPSRHEAMRGSDQRCANDGSSVTRRRCCAPLAAAAAARMPSSSWASAGSIARSSASPAALSTMRRPGRSKSSKPELRFEQLDLLADRAVREMQLFGRGTQVGQARDSAEGGQGLQGEAHQLVSIADQSLSRYGRFLATSVHLC